MVEICNIDWDTDNEVVELPSVVLITNLADTADDQISNALSNNFGWCVKGYDCAGYSDEIFETGKGEFLYRYVSPDRRFRVIIESDDSGSGYEYSIWNHENGAYLASSYCPESFVVMTDGEILNFCLRTLQKYIAKEKVVKLGNKNWQLIWHLESSRITDMNAKALVEA